MTLMMAMTTVNGNDGGDDYSNSDTGGDDYGD